jgi:DNA-directed RNA polymerase sigma subunit (sigma70/sigma32)
MYYEKYFIKTAADDKPLSPKEMKYQHERELIERVQKYNDPMAMAELQRLYRPAINQCIDKSGILSAMDYNTAYATAIQSFRHMMKNTFKLEDRRAAPITYVYNTLPDLLRKAKYNNRNTLSRMSEDLSMKSESVAIADENLKKRLGRIGTNEETYDFIKNELGRKSISPDDVNKVRQRTRKELSGDQQLGNTEGAEYLSFMDVMNVGELSPEDEYNSLIHKQQVEALINALPRRDRRVVMNALGWGEFKGKKVNISQLALNNGMTGYEVRKILGKFQKTLREHNL